MRLLTHYAVLVIIKYIVRKIVGKCVMKKINISKLFFILSAVFAVIFPINTVIDYVNYQNSLNSAPFYIWIWANILYFIVPAVIAFIVGLVLRKSKSS